VPAQSKVSVPYGLIAGVSPKPDRHRAPARNCTMPLYPRPAAHHYPDAPSSYPDRVVILCGSLEVGGFHPIMEGPSKGNWSWSCGLTGEAGFTATGFARSSDECKRQIGTAFRAMLARAGLRERHDAMPGPPRRASSDAIADTSGPAPAFDPNADRHRGPMVRNERRIAVRSGELNVGMLNRSTHGAESWWWYLTGLPRPGGTDFTWRGNTDTEQQAFDEFSACWSQWLEWAGLEQVVPLQRGAKRA
jgi:hypothetical protein